MATVAARNRHLLIPREHGAWATLIMPYLVGVGVAGRLVPEAALFLLAAIALFAARYPLNLVAKALSQRDAGSAARSMNAITFSLAIYSTVAVICGATLLFGYGRWVLLPFGLLALLLLALQFLLQRNRLDRTAQGELIAFAGLTLAGPGVYCASTGLLEWKTAMVWLLTFLYAGSSVFYVKLRVQQRVQRGNMDTRHGWTPGVPMGIYQAVLLLIVAALVATQAVPSLVLLAFTPLTFKVIRALTHTTTELNLRRLGFIEVAHTVLFAAIVIGAYRL